MPGTVLLNGVAVEAGLSADRAFHFGDGLFETLAVIDGVPCLWERHFLRLQQGCERLGIAAPDQALLREEAGQLAHSQAQAVLKIIISAGQGQRGYARTPQAPVTRWLQCSAWPSTTLYATDHPLHLQWCETRLGQQPVLAGIKHLNRLEQVLARREISAPDVEGVMLNQAGDVVEGISSNLLLRTGKRYLTAAIVDCGVAGVVRQLVLDMAQVEDVEVQVAKVSREDLSTADAVYVMNSLLGVRPAASLDGRAYATQPLPDFLQRAHAACFTANGVV